MQRKKNQAKINGNCCRIDNHNSMQCGTGATEERSRDDSGTTIKAATIEFGGEFRSTPRHH
jgi:hypothetical protein